jgi:pimeloyl-ACP methyl ester carboxylesterase
MKRKSLLMIFALLTLSLVAIFTFMGSDPLDEEAHLELKKGKLFWQWNSPYGVLSTHFIEAGSGDQHILFIHGFRAHTFTWRHLIDPLVKSGYHVWSIDLMGYGLSDKPYHLPYDTDFFLHQIIAFMKAKGIASAHVAGNSMGGGIALKLALEEPSKVRSLTLISALGYPLKLPLYLAIARHITDLWPPFLGPTMVRNSLKQVIYKLENLSDEQVEAYNLPYRLPGGSHATLATLKSYDNEKLYKLCQRYSEIYQPLLIIWGEFDSLIPIHHFKKFKKDFPAAETLLIKDCGHIAQEEEPEQVVAAMTKFLSKQQDHKIIK